MCGLDIVKGMKNNMMIIEPIKDEQYEKLIKYAISKNDAVMFVFRKDKFKLNNDLILKISKNSKNLKQKLSASFLKSRNGSYWVFTKVGYSQLGISDINIPEFNDPPGFDDLFEILFFKVDKNAEEYLLSNKDLYSWLNPKYPEDIAFFNKGYCWMYSVTHEEYCNIACENEEEYNYLKSIGIKFVEKSFEKTPVDELYFEKY